MVNIAENLRILQDSLPKGVNLVAVSKFHPAEVVAEAYNCGQRVFGESRAQELVQKKDLLPSDIDWHFIGHLQTNKVKMIVPIARLIHSIDSERLLEVVDEETRKINRTVDVLLQLHVAKEATKFGMTCDECEDFVSSGRYANLKNVRIRGVMGMATNTDDEAEIRKEFREIRRVFDSLRHGAMSEFKDFDTVSMGMSDDYKIAIEEGSTMVRIGSSLFGERRY